MSITFNYEGIGQCFLTFAYGTGESTKYKGTKRQSPKELCTVVLSTPSRDYTYTAIRHEGDKHNWETARKYALKGLLAKDGWDGEFKKAVWAAYVWPHGNPNIKPKPKTPTALELMEDVVRLIEADLFTPTVNSYVALTERALLEHGEESAQQFIQSGGMKHCRACAMGAMLLAYVDKANQLKVQEMGVSGYQGHSIICKTLDGIVSKKQLLLMEAAFERRSEYCEEEIASGLLSRIEVNKAISFGSAYGYSQRERLLAIMKNGIENGGVFDPGK